MKKPARAIALILCLTLMAALLCGCGEKSKVQKVLSSFESACRRGDVDAIMDCCDPKVIAPIRSAMNLLGADADSLSDLLNAIMGLGTLTGAVDENDDPVQLLKDFRIEPVDYAFNSDKTACTVTVKCSGAIYGENYTEDGTIDCVLRDGSWYIALD